MAPDDPNSKTLRRVFAHRLEYMMESIGGAIYGGMFFVAMVFGFALLLATLSGGSLNNPLSDLLFGLGLLFMLEIATVIFFGFGIMAATLFVNFVNWSFGYVLTAREAIIVAGGLTGYLFGLVPLVLSGVVFTSSWETFSLAPEQLVCLAIGLAAIFVCSIAAMIHETRHTSRYYGLSCAEQETFRLSIRHLLAITVWFSILMAISTVLFGNYWPLIIVMLYLFFQSLIVITDRWWRGRKTRKRARREEAPKVYVHPLDAP